MGNRFFIDSRSSAESMSQAENSTEIYIKLVYFWLRNLSQSFIVSRFQRQSYQPIKLSGGLILLIFVGTVDFKKLYKLLALCYFFT